MYDITEANKELLITLLKLEDFWDKKRTENINGKVVRKLHYNALIEAFHEWHEVEWCDHLAFPALVGAYTIVQVFNFFPGIEWEEITFGLDETWDEHKCLAPVDPMICDFVQDAINPWLRDQWNSERWRWQEPTIDEIRELIDEYDLYPNMVPTKTDKQGHIQPSMF